MAPSSPYSQQIDSLRALAVLGVLIQHWFLLTSLGGWGVVLFFVISGFLITRNIEQLRDSGLSTRAAAETFFIRRSLRLFPAYYLVLLVGALCWNLADLRRDWPWYVAYLSNMLLFYREYWISLTPTWSLAVEEQFYILWFVAIIALPRRMFYPTIIALVVLAFQTRLHYFSAGNPFGTHLLWANCDALAIGALLCRFERQARRLPLAGLPAALLALLAVALGKDTGNVWILALEQTVVVLVSAHLVWFARDGFAGPLGALLGMRALAWLGKISYGIYLYHMLTPYIVADLLRVVPFVWRLSDTFAFHVGLTVALAALSFRFFESPIRYGLTQSILRRRGLVAVSRAPLGMQRRS